MIKVVKRSGLATKIEAYSKKISAFTFISVDSRSIHYSKKGIKDYCLWAMDCFDRFLLLIVDLPQTYNYLVFKKYSLSEAQHRAETVGQDKKRALEKIIRDLRKDKVQVQGFKEMYEQEHYKKIHSVISDYFVKNTQFRSDLLLEMENLLRSGGKLREDVEADVNLANFLIEEISAFFCLTEFMGYQIEIAHQEEFQLVKNIFNSKYEGLLELLELLKLEKEVGYIQTELTLKG